MEIPAENTANASRCSIRALIALSLHPNNQRSLKSQLATSQSFPDPASNPLHREPSPKHVRPD